MDFMNTDSPAMQRAKNMQALESSLSAKLNEERGP
jgi:hypothetical protein